MYDFRRKNFLYHPTGEFEFFVIGEGSRRCGGGRLTLCQKRGHQRQSRPSNCFNEGWGNELVISFACSSTVKSVENRNLCGRRWIRTSFFPSTSSKFSVINNTLFSHNRAGCSKQNKSLNLLQSTMLLDVAELLYTYVCGRKIRFYTTGGFRFIVVNRASCWPWWKRL